MRLPGYRNIFNCIAAIGFVIVSCTPQKDIQVTKISVTLKEIKPGKMIELVWEDENGITYSEFVVTNEILLGTKMIYLFRR